MPGPKGTTNHVNRDTYDGNPPVAGILPAPPKQINAADAKVGSPSPTSGRRGATINSDSYYE